MNPSQVSFLVRGDISSLIEKRIEALEKGYRQNIGLVGLSGSGKTYFLSSLFQTISVHPRFIPIYVQAEGMDLDHFADRWTGAILTGLFLSQGVQPPQTFHSLLLAADPIIPKTTDRIRALKKSLRREKSAALLKELFSISEIFAQETGKKLILMIDEFDQLDSLGVPDPFGILGKEIMVQKNTLYLVASSAPSKAREIFKEKLSMLFGNFEVLDMGRFGFEETAAFLRTRFPEIEFSESQKEFLIRITDGKPDYLELILDQLGNCLASHAVRETTFIKNEAGEMSSNYLLESIHRELTAPYGRLEQLFQKKITACRAFGKDAAPALRVLIAMSHGRYRLNAIASAVERKIQDTKKILARLEGKDLIQRRGAFYLLEDPLFHFWLREVFEKSRHLYRPDRGMLEEELMLALKREFEKTEACERGTYERRIESLMKEFRNDSFEIDGRKIQCPQFTEMNVRASGLQPAVFMAKNSKAKWHCQLHYGQVNEDEVTAFLEDLKKYRKKPQQKILFMLRGIEQNAKLMAQEAGVQLWDLRLLNTLLDLYDLPKIVLLPERDTPHGSNVGALAQGVYTARLA